MYIPNSSTGVSFSSVWASGHKNSASMATHLSCPSARASCRVLGILLLNPWQPLKKWFMAFLISKEDGNCEQFAHCS